MYQVQEGGERVSESGCKWWRGFETRLRSLTFFVSDLISPEYVPEVLKYEINVN